MASRFTIEVVTSSVQSSMNAQAGGAGRIELCSALGVAGVTPSGGLLAEVVANVSLPVYCMIRPREGDFVYSSSEFSVMKRDIQMAKDLGAAGIVLGILNPKAEVDVKRTTELVRLAHPLPVTFHRAFDIVPHLEHALDSIIECGCWCVLTSGGMASGPEGAAKLHELAEQAIGRIEIMPGGGITSESITAVMHKNISNYHLSGRVPMHSALHTKLFEMDYAETSEEVIAATHRQLHAFFEGKN